MHICSVKHRVDWLMADESLLFVRLVSCTKAFFLYFPHVTTHAGEEYWLQHCCPPFFLRLFLRFLGEFPLSFWLRYHLFLISLHMLWWFCTPLSRGHLSIKRISMWKFKYISVNQHCFEGGSVFIVIRSDRMIIALSLILIKNKLKLWGHFSNMTD